MPVEQDELISEDLETEVLNISGGLVIDSDDTKSFVDELEALFEKYSYLSQFNFNFN